MAKGRNRTRRGEDTKQSLPRSDFPFTPNRFRGHRKESRPTLDDYRREKVRRESYFSDLDPISTGRNEWSNAPRKLAATPTGEQLELFEPAALAVGERLPGPIDPELVCARRTVREQVLHALGHSGKSGQKKPRYTNASKVRCK